MSGGHTWVPESPLWWRLAETPLPVGSPPSYHKRLSSEPKYKYSQERSPPDVCIQVTYNRRWTHSWWFFLVTEWQQGANTQRAWHLCAFGSPRDQQGGMRYKLWKGVGKAPKDKLMISLVFDLGSPTHRCNAHNHSQGVGGKKGSQACRVGKMGDSHMQGKWWAWLRNRGMTGTRWAGKWEGRKATNRVQMPMFLVFMEL